MSSPERNVGKGRRGTLRAERSEGERKRLRLRFAMAINRCDDDATTLARKLDICPSAISKWIKGQALPGLDLVGPLAKAVGVDPGWFWSDAPWPNFEPRIPRATLKSAIPAIPKDFFDGGPC